MPLSTEYQMVIRSLKNDDNKEAIELNFLHQKKEKRKSMMRIKEKIRPIIQSTNSIADEIRYKVCTLLIKMGLDGLLPAHMLPKSLRVF